MEELFAMLDDLEVQISEGTRVPLTNQYVINRDSMLATIVAIRDSLPEAMHKANGILEREAQLKEDANNRFNNTIAEAESKARAMILENKQRADKMVNDAQLQSSQLYEDAKRKADDLVISAERRAQELVSQTAIMTEADREASRILSDARAEGQRDRMAALDICDKLLKHVEDIAIDVANKLRDERMNFDRDR